MKIFLAREYLNVCKMDRIRKNSIDSKTIINTVRFVPKPTTVRPILTSIGARAAVQKVNYELKPLHAVLRVMGSCNFFHFFVPR
jgi:hypothetical protein